MGLDGGTKPTRSDVLRRQSWRLSQADGTRSTRGGSVNQASVFAEQQLDDATRRAVAWSTCALSGQPLAPPLVADATGQLLNRAAVVEHLVAAREAAAAGGGSTASAKAAAQAAAAAAAAAAACSHGAGAACEDAAALLRYANQQRVGSFEHIRSLKDVFAVQLTPNPERQPAGSREEPARWVCPVTLLPAGSIQPFSALRPCGHVVSDKALVAVSGGRRQRPGGARGGSSAAGAAAAAADAGSDGGGGGDAAAARTCCCPVCEAVFGPAQDVVPLCRGAEHMAAVRQQLQAKAAAKQAKRDLKRQREAAAAQPPALEGAGAPPPALEAAARVAGSAAPGARLAARAAPGGASKVARLMP